MNFISVAERAERASQPQLNPINHFISSLRMKKWMSDGWVALAAQAYAEQINGINLAKHEARRKNRLAIACFLCGLLAGRSPRQLALKEDERPAPTHSLSSTAQQLTLLWLWLGKPTKEMSCAVGLIESGGWLVVFIVSGLRAAAAAIAPLTRKTSNNPINP